MPPYRPKKILGGDEGFELFFQKYAAVDEIGGVFDAIDVFRDPEQRLQIAQAPLGLFDVGFDDIAQTLLAVPRVALFQLGLDKAATGACKQIGLERFVKILRQRGICSDKPVFQQSGLNGEIFAPKGHAIADGAR